jgi:hypothetical protein
MEKRLIIRTEATYTFPLKEVLEALGLEFNQKNCHCISIGMDNQIPTVEIKIESCVEK